MKKLKIGLLGAGLMAMASISQAAVIGTQAFADIGTASTDTGDINTATVFTIGDLFSTSNTGYFAGMPNQVFGTVTFDTTVGTSLSFGDAAFGSFSSSAILLASDVPGAVAFYVAGTWTAGTYGNPTSAAPDTEAASFTISYNQTPAGSGSISDSATLSIPPVPPPGTPEPATMAMVGSALIGLGFMRRRKA